MRIMLASFLALSLLAGCGGMQDQDHAQTKQRTTRTDSDKYVAKEYNQHRAYSLSQNGIQHPDLAIRLSNEAERVYNVDQAVALVHGRDIIMGITTKPDPIQPHHKTLKRVRQRLESKEPSLAGYNLHFTNNPRLLGEIMQARVFLENSVPDKTAQQQSEQHFRSILGRIQHSDRFEPVK